METIRNGKPLTSVNRVLAVLFVAALALTSLTPYVLGLSARLGSISIESFDQISFWILLLSAFHQSASFVVYFDRDASTVLRNNKAHFFIIPIIIVLTVMLVFICNWKPLIIAFWSGYTLFSIYHYQKQNLGIFGLLAPILGGGGG